MKNILVIQLTRLGDIIQSIPLTQVLHTKYPEANIFILISEIFQESKFLIKNAEIIPINLDNFVKQNEIVKNSYLLGIITDLNAKSFDFVVNLNNSHISRYITDKVNSTEKKGFGQAGFSKIWTAYVTSFLKTRWFNSVNLVDIFMIMAFGEGGDWKSPLLGKHRRGDLRSPIQPSNHKVVALQTGARNQKRQFTIQQYKEISEFYLQKGYQIYLFGMESESHTAKAIKRAVLSDAIIDLTGKTNLQELSQKINECEMVYTPDTGTMHLAAYLGVPITAFFCGPAYPFETVAYTDNIKIFMPNSEKLSCYPCSDDNVCVGNYKCKEFSFQKMFQNLDNPGFIELKSAYDELGQILYPINDKAKLWRDFSKYYFLASIPQTTPTFKAGDYLSSSSIATQLKRELRLFEMIDISDLDNVNNFDLLKPLLYYMKLSGDKELVDSFKTALSPLFQ